MDKTKRNTGTRALSAIMAILLALTMCLPSMVFSKEAWAATTTSITATISDLAFLPEYEDAGLGDPTPYVFVRDNKVLIYNMEDSISKVTVDGDESSEKGITLRELSEQKSLIDEGLGQGTSLPEEYASAIVDFTNYTPGVYQINVSIYNPRDPSGNSDAVCGLQLTISEGSESEVSLKLTSPEKMSKGTSYTAIKVFDADITGKYDANEAPKASNIKFAAGVTADVIKAAGDPDFEPGVDAAHQDLTNAQNAAEYISANIEHNHNAYLTAGSYGIEFAKRLIETGADTTAITADEEIATALSGEGYYLIVKTDDLYADEDNTAATSPIFAALDEGENIIVLKTAVPTLTKQIQEDSNDEWGKEADHTLNQDVHYKLNGTIAENVASFETYKYIFHDKWDADKMTLKGGTGSVTVKIGNTDITAAATIKTDVAGELTVSFDDLKAVYPTLSYDDVVVVEYTAYQSGTTASPEGIENLAYLEYANNPMAESTGTTPKDQTTDYSYAFRIHKTDNSTGESLDGAKFTVQNTNGLYIAKDADGKIIELPAAEDGSIPAGAEWTTDENGFIVLDGIDADTYTSIETVAPSDAYDALDAPFTFEINATDRNNIESSIGEHALVNLENDDAISFGSVNVKNIKKIDLPSTGECGLRLLLIIALSVGVVAYIKRRNRKDETASVLTI